MFHRRVARIVTVALLMDAQFVRVTPIIMVLRHIAVQSAQLTPSVPWIGLALTKNV